MAQRKQAVKLLLTEEQARKLDEDRGVIPRATFLLDFWWRRKTPSPAEKKMGEMLAASLGMDPEALAKAAEPE